MHQHPLPRLHLLLAVRLLLSGHLRQIAGQITAYLLRQEVPEGSRLGMVGSPFLLQYSSFLGDFGENKKALGKLRGLSKGKKLVGDAGLEPATPCL